MLPYHPGAASRFRRSAQDGGADMREDFSEAEERVVRDQLSRILESEPFRKSERRQRFLRFIVNEALAGRARLLKGYNVALEVFGRTESFDSALDPVVRVEAGRLREKLRDYYETIGRGDAVRINLPKGTYAPEIAFGCAKADPGAAPPVGSGLMMDKGYNVRLGRKALAVLPFVNLSGDPNNNYLGDGFADALVTDLAKVSGLFVVSRHSSFLYRGSNLSVGRIAEALRVGFVVEGSIQTAGGRLRVCASVLDPRSERSVWSARFEGALDEIFDIQDHISRGVACALSVRLTPQEDRLVGRRGTHNAMAHDALMRGLSLFCGYSKSSCEEAQVHLHEASRLDPGYAAPHAWLARTYVLQHCMNWLAGGAPPLDPALEHGQIAVSLDGTSAFAHAVAGWTLLFRKDGAGALSAAERACALDAYLPDGRMFQSLIQSSTGNAEAAQSSIDAALLFQPLPSAFCFYALGMCRFAKNDYDGALNALRRGAELNAAFLPIHYALAITYGLCGLLPEARAATEIVRLKAPNISKSFFLEPRLAGAYAEGKRAAGL
jgi:adenylate cyclase